MQWDDTNTVVLKEPKENTMPTKEKKRCAGCGETKILLSKTLCHKCFKAPKKEEEQSQEPPAGPIAMPENEAPVQDNQDSFLRLDFGQDTDLLAALQEQAHRNYRSLNHEIFAALRDATGVARPKSAN